MDSIAVEKVEHTTEPNNSYQAYNVNVGDHRILTIVTSSELTASKWIKDSKKAYNSRSLPNTVFVGLSVQRRFEKYSRHGLCNTPYDLLQLCIGSHCLLYHLPYPSCAHSRCPRFLNSFLSNPKVVVVGMEIKEKAAALERDFGVNISHLHDLKELAVAGMKIEEAEAGSYDLDRLANVVLGESSDLVREKSEWFKDGMSGELTEKKVLVSTVDAYLSWKIGVVMYDVIHGGKDKKMKNKKK